MVIHTHAGTQAGHVEHPAWPSTRSVRRGAETWTLRSWIPGRNAQQTVKDVGRLPLRAWLAVAERTLTALRRAHELGVLHLRIHPENVILSPIGFSYLTDPGEPFDEDGPWTDPAIRRGAPPDERADVYGIAAVLHLLGTGRAPGAGRSGDLPEAIARCLARALDEDRRERPWSAGELLEGLRGASTDHMATVRPPPALSELGASTGSVPEERTMALAPPSEHLRALLREAPKR